ncbi:MAG: hypothetical protein ACYCUM_11690 [Solirubrobacteraceae bacterium]
MSDHAGTLWLVAPRRTSHGGPHTTLHIAEVWAEGLDPLRLAPPLDSWHLYRCSWHAQLGAPGDLNAERLDIDRDKPRSHVRHRHPYGQPNARREPTAINTPRAWLAEVERIVASLYPATDKSNRSPVD